MADIKKILKTSAKIAIMPYKIQGRLIRTAGNVYEATSLTGIIRKGMKHTSIDNMGNYKKGDHIYVQRIGYTHHGIYIGDGMVIHYLRTGVTYDTIEKFAEGEVIFIKRYLSILSTNEIIERAKSKVCEDNYNVVFNNCEHFARWCRGSI